MAGTPSFSRAQVLAHRAHLQGISGTTAPAELEVLDVLALGLQDTPGGSAALGLRARAGDAARVAAPELVLALTARGSPHLHRRSDLPVLRSALPRPATTRCSAGSADWAPSSSGRAWTSSRWPRRWRPECGRCSRATPRPRASCRRR